MRKQSTGDLVSRGKVLVVDDESMILDLVRLVLEGAGFSVATADSARHLREALRAEAPDVVLLDVGLPGLPGDQAVRSIRSGASAQPVSILLYSGEEEQQLERLARSVGANGAVTKVSATSVLLAEVERAMNAVRGRETLAAALEV